MQNLKLISQPEENLVTMEDLEDEDHQINTKEMSKYSMQKQQLNLTAGIMLKKKGSNETN